MSIRTSPSPSELKQYINEVESLTAGFDLLKDHVIITDEHATILYANKAVEENTGFSISEVIGKNPGDVWGGHMEKGFYEGMWHTIKVEKKPFHGEVRNIKKDGSEYWQELLISPILDADGEVQFFIGIEPDITDRKKQEQFREEFISIIGHQLRSPLTAIQWTLELLVKRGQLTAQQREKLAQVYADSRGLLNLVSDLLLVVKLNKGQALPTTEIDLAELIEQIITKVKKRNSDVSISFEQEGSPFPITTTASLASQVFVNIISNAVEYSSKEKGKVLASLKRDGDYYIFSCKDNGIGIPEKEQDKIFSRLFRASNAREAKEGGTGLGLFIVNMIADSFGWDVSFESKVKEGTTFFVKIPTK